MKTAYFGGGTGGGPGAGVTSFNGRTGAVVSVSGDYDSSEVINTSSISGASVSDALNTLGAAIAGLVTGVSSFNTRTGAVVPANGDYTAAQITNDSGVAGAAVSDALNTLNAAIDLTGSRVSNGPANTFLAGGVAGNQWLPTFTGPVSPTDNGKTVIASGGDFTYLAGGTTGQMLNWTGATWAPGVDFGALNPVTTGGFLANASTGFVRLGLANGSGSGVASSASVGNIRGARGANGFQIAIRNNLDTADLTLLTTDTTTGPTVTLGNTTAGGLSPALHAPSAGSITLRVGSSATQLQLTTASVSSLIPRIEFFSTVATGTFGMQTTGTNGVTGNKVNYTGQDCTGTTTTGGAVDMRPGSGTTAGGLFRGMSGGGAVVSAQRIAWNDTGISFFTAAPVAQQTILGSRGGNAALADFLTKLALTGLIVDGTSA